MPPKGKCDRCGRIAYLVDKIPSTDRPGAYCTDCWGDGLTEAQNGAFFPPETWPLDTLRELNGEVNSR